MRLFIVLLVTTLFMAGCSQEPGTPSADTAVAKNVATPAMNPIQAAIANPAVDQELTKNLQLQRELDLSGTPAWVVGNKVLVGAVGYDALKAAIAEARAAKAAR